MELTKVIICDPDNPTEIVDWTVCHCESLTAWESVDVSDVSGQYDIMIEFCFSNPAEATMFILKWGVK